MSGEENFPMFSHLIHIPKTAEYRERTSRKLAELTWPGVSSSVSVVVHYLHFIREVMALTTLAMSFLLFFVFFTTTSCCVVM